MIENIHSIFGDWENGNSEASIHKNHKAKVDILEFPTIPKQDSEPITIIMPDFKEGPWIAGGACLRWYQGQPVGESDIDIFCRDEQQARSVIENIKSYGRHSVKYESENAVTLEYRSSEDWTTAWTLQVITRRYFTGAQAVIDNFDITVCQLATDGNNWLLGKHTARDIRERNLRMKYPLCPDAAKRLTKYWTYGYRPVENLLEDIRNNPTAKQVFQIDGDYENAF